MLGMRVSSGVYFCLMKGGEFYSDEKNHADEIAI